MDLSLRLADLQKHESPGATHRSGTVHCEVLGAFSQQPFFRMGYPPMAAEPWGFSVVELIGAEGLVRLLKGDAIPLGRSQPRVPSQSSSPLSAGRPVQGAPRAMLGGAEANLLPLQLSRL